MVAQTGRFGYFEFPLTVVLVDRGGAQHRYLIPVAARGATRFEIDQPGGEIARVIVDPDVTTLVRTLSP
jgi:hypothetical protein